MIVTRRAGLHHCMPEEPEFFATQTNKLGMAMTYSQHRSNVLRTRKKKNADQDENGASNLYEDALGEIPLSPANKAFTSPTLQVPANKTLE